MKLYGTTASPYVRRVRIVATELGVPFELVSTVSDEAEKALRALTPVWKKPVAEIDGEVIWDSHVIIEHLLRRHGYGPLRTAGGAAWLREHNLMTAIDGALDSGVQVFQLVREGINPDSAAYLIKQRERVTSIMGWLEKHVRGSWLTDEPRLGLAEIFLITTLEWMVFRKRYEIEKHPALEQFRAAHADRESVRSTYPAE